jgi:uncharacterized protein YeaO (DUF488 family)
LIGFGPGGFKKANLPSGRWLKQVAPSDKLRKWFGHDSAKWSEFRRRYEQELEVQPGSWQPLAAASQKGKLTLLFSARDTEHNNAVALKAFLEKRQHAAGD